MPPAQKRTLPAPCRAPGVQPPALSRRRTTSPVKRGSGLFPPPPRASWCRELGGRLPAAPEVAPWETRAGPGRAGGPAAARYVRAQGLRAGMTDSEREIPGGGGSGSGAASAGGSRRPGGEERLWRKGTSPRTGAAGQREEGAGRRGLLSPVGRAAWGTRGSDGGAEGRGASPAFALPAPRVRAGARELRGSLPLPALAPLGPPPARRCPRRRALPL